MHERKAEMARQADAFIALPGTFQSASILLDFSAQNLYFMVLVLSGGYGTMEEVLEMITWSQLGIHKNL